MAWVPSVSRTSLNAQNTAESTPCPLSTKLKPDSRGLGPAIHATLSRAEKSHGCARVKPAHDEPTITGTGMIQPTMSGTVLLGWLPWWNRTRLGHVSRGNSE